jgi:uracil-DNA glycosylase
MCEGMNCLQELIGLLPRLRAVVMVGKSAAKAKTYLAEKHPGLHLFCSAHPSPLVRAKFPDRWKGIPSQWAGFSGALVARDNKARHLRRAY